MDTSGDQLHAERMEGRTFADMMEQICLFMRIDKSREMVLASLATQGMAQGQSPQQHLTNISADFHSMNMPDKELEALRATILSMERHAPAYRLQLLAMLDSGKISMFREATNETRNMTHFSLVTPTFGYPKTACQYSVQQLRQEDPTNLRNQASYQTQQHQPQTSQQSAQKYQTHQPPVSTTSYVPPPAASPATTLPKPTQHSSPEEKRAYFQNLAGTKGCIYCKKKGHLRNECLAWYEETSDGQKRRNEAPWAYNRAVQKANHPGQSPSQRTPSSP